METGNQTKLGEILINNGVITEEELKDLLTLQAECKVVTGQHVKLGTIIFLSKSINEAPLKKAINEQKALRKNNNQP